MDGLITFKFGTLEYISRGGSIFPHQVLRYKVLRYKQFRATNSIFWGDVFQNKFSKLDYIVSLGACPGIETVARGSDFYFLH